MADAQGDGEYLKLQNDGSEPQASEANVDSKDNSGISQQPPASNPGSDDPSGGIAAGSGGVSSSAYVLSPVPSEQKSASGIVQSTVDTVKSYLSGLSLGGGGKEEEARNAGPEEDNSASASGAAAAAGGAAATTAAATSTSEEKSETPAADQTSVGAATAKDEAMTDREQKDESAKKDDSEEKNEGGGEEKNEGGGEEKNEGGGEEKNEGGGEEKNEGGGEEKNEGGGEEKKEEAGDDSQKKKSPGQVRENKDAIPTAGGEKLGEKHWGESQIVPDVPKPKETENVSSAEGQPDQQTKDNTAANTGGASEPHGESEEGKQKLTDKIKDKLPFGKKE